MLILQLLFHSRMITIDHMYALHHCCQHNLHVMSLPQIQITTHLHESGPKAPTCPSSITTLILLSGLRNFSHNHPGGELNKTEGTSSVQVPSLSYSREQNHTGGLKPFSRSDMPLWHCRPKYHLAYSLIHFSKWHWELQSSLLDAVLCIPLLDGVMSLQLSEPLQKLLKWWALLWVAAHGKGKCNQEYTNITKYKTINFF